MGFVLSFVMGLGVMRFLTGDKPFRTVDLFFSWGLGVGLASQLTFFAVLVGGRHSHEVLCLLAVIVIAGIWGVLLKKKPSCPVAFAGPPASSFLILMLPLILAQMFVYWNLPYGDWDAWSLWNYRANALFRSAGDWLPVYHNVVQGNHPWLLPHYVVWGWTFAGQETTWVPAGTAFLMSFATVGLLVYALASTAGRLPALLAGLYLISIPYFDWHAAGQYASVFVAFFFLACWVAAREYLRAPSLKDAAVAGAFLAFLANAKDEGIVLAVLIALFLRGIFKGQDKGHGRVFLTVFLSLMVMFVLTEIFMRAPLGIPFVGGRYGTGDLSLLWDAGRWQVLGLFFCRQIAVHPVMGGLFFLVIVSALLEKGGETWAGKSALLRRAFLQVTAAFFLVFSVLYIVATTDLSWRLSVTAYRLVFIFLPTAVYVMFGHLYKNEQE